MNGFVVTYCHVRNYGAELQSYAVLRILSLIGVKAKLLNCADFKMPDRKIRNAIIRRAILKRIFYRFPIGFYDLIRLVAKLALKRRGKCDKDCMAAYDLQCARYEDFWLGYQDHIDVDDLKTFPFDRKQVYVAGSDQIWNWTKTSSLAHFFLDFAPKNARRISFAASVSDDYLPATYRDIIVRGLKNFDYISVREKQGQKVIEALTEKKVSLVLDPTLLLDKNDWLRISSDAIKIKGPYILSYSLNESQRYARTLRAYMKKTGLAVVSIRANPFPSGIDGAVDVFDAGPREFLSLFSNASFVFTNSFHGTVFSINFKVPFVSLLNPASTTNSRVLSIVEILGLSDRAVMDDDKKSIENALKTNIDFQSAHEKLNIWREKTRCFLREALS